MTTVDVSFRCARVRVYPRDFSSVDVDVTGLDLYFFIRSAGVDAVTAALDEVVAQRNAVLAALNVKVEIDAGDLTNF